MSACSCVTDGVGDEARVLGGAGISSADATSELSYKEQFKKIFLNKNAFQ